MPLNATTDTPHEEPTVAPLEGDTGTAAPLHTSSMGELAGMAKRVIERQGEIWIAQAKLQLLRLGVFLGLLVASAAFLVVMLIFFLMGVFRILTDVAHIAPVWSCLIFAAFCGICAVAALIPIGFARKKKKRIGNSRRSSEAAQ